MTGLVTPPGDDADVDATLTAADYAILRGVPAEWWSEEDVIREIALASRRGVTAIRGALTRFAARGLVERRTRQTIAPTREIRRVAKA